METLISMKNATKNFGNVRAVDNVCLEVGRGEILGILGPNASGKTTSVRLLNGVIFPDDGTITVMGMDSVRSGGEIRRRTGVLTETATLYENMTARENLQFFADLYGVEPHLTKKRIDDLLEQFGFTGRERQKVGRYSTGLKKRLGIARALIHHPEILYLDEPTSGLDPEASRDLVSYIRQLNRERLTVVVCTHNLAEAEHFCSRFVFLDRGRVIENGSLAALEEKYAGKRKLRVDYRGDLEHALPAGVEIERLPAESGTDRAVLTVMSKKRIPEVIRALSAKIDLYCAEPADSGLENIYFEVRKRVQ